MSVSKPQTIMDARFQGTHNSSRPPYTREPVTEPLYGRDYEGAKAVHPGVRKVRIGAALVPLITHSNIPYVRIWHKYKDEFAKARLREMTIVE